MEMMPFLIPTATSRPFVTWAWLTSNWLTWPASSEDVASRSNHDGLHSAPSANIIGVIPAVLSLPRSAMKAAQLAGAVVMPALANAALLKNIPVSTLDPRMMSISPLGEVMYGIVDLENRDSQLVLPG